MDGEEMTLKEIGIAEGLSPTRIQQVEAKGMRKLRHPSRSSSLIDYVTNKGKK
jgi:RNA polymerase primary sigma factor